MPWGLTRFHYSGQSHFVTFCCYHRRRLFTTDASQRIFESGGLAHPLRHLAQAAPPFAVFEGWELGISGAKLLQKDRLIRVQGTRDHLFDLGSMDETCA